MKNNNTGKNRKNRRRSFLRGMFAGAAGASLLFAGAFAGIRLMQNFSLTSEVYGMAAQDNGSVEALNKAQAEKLVDAQFLIKLQGLESWVKQYFLFDIPDEETVQTALYRAYMDTLDDPYSCYYTAEEYEDMMESTEGTYYGIGVMVSQDPETNELTAIRVFPDSPGQKAGMLAGDIIKVVDGTDVTDMDINSIVALIKGEIGTEVAITVYRPSAEETLDLVAVRDKIEVPTIESELLDGGIGYIAVTEFDGVTDTQFEAKLEELKKAGMKGLVIDLRDNPGGLLDVVLNMLDIVLPEGLLLYTEDKDGKGDRFYSDAEHYFDQPLVILVNENSASASEVFTGAVRDYGAGLIVGTKTFGKGIVQSIFPLTDGCAIKLTTSRYFTPAGICIHGEGITPDIVVELDEELATQYEITFEDDNQLQAAIKALNAMIASEDPLQLFEPATEAPGMDDAA